METEGCIMHIMFKVSKKIKNKTQELNVYEYNILYNIDIYKPYTSLTII